MGGIENPAGADYAFDPVEVPPLREAMSGKINLMVNLANDAIGYIIPKSEAMKLPGFTGLLKRLTGRLFHSVKRLAQRCIGNS